MNRPSSSLSLLLSRHTRRRDFVAFLGGAMTWMSTARAQEPRQVIGFLSGFSDALPGALAAFYQGLKETGFVQGKNLSIEFRWAGGQYDRLPSLAAELVARNVSVIVAYDVPSAFAAKEATKTIPIVFGSALIRLSWASWIASISLAATSPGCSLY